MDFQSYLIQFEEEILNLKEKLNFKERRGSSIFLLAKFRDVLNMINSTRRDFAKEALLLNDILLHMQTESSCVENFFKCFLDFFNLKKTEWDSMKLQYKERGRLFYEKAMEYKNVIEKALHTTAHLTGSIASQTACTSTDYDFGLEGKVTNQTKERLEEAFGSNVKHIQFHIVKKLHLITIQLNNGDKLDVVAECNTVGLQRVLYDLDINQRLTIVCVKALLKKLRLIDTKLGRLPSCSIGVSLLCANRDQNYLWTTGSFFSQFCHYFEFFDFDEFKMTTNGPVKKRGSSAKVEILDVVNQKWNSAAGRTTPDVIAVVGLWMGIFAAFDGLEEYLGSII